MLLLIFLFVSIFELNSSNIIDEVEFDCNGCWGLVQTAKLSWCLRKLIHSEGENVVSLFISYKCLLFRLSLHKWHQRPKSSHGKYICWNHMVKRRKYSIQAYLHPSNINTWLLIGLLPTYLKMTSSTLIWVLETNSIVKSTSKSKLRTVYFSMAFMLDKWKLL